MDEESENSLVLDKKRIKRAINEFKFGKGTMSSIKIPNFLCGHLKGHSPSALQNGLCKNRKTADNHSILYLIIAIHIHINFSPKIP